MLTMKCINCKRIDDCINRDTLSEFGVEKNLQEFLWFCNCCRADVLTDAGYLHCWGRYGYSVAQRAVKAARAKVKIKALAA